MSLYFKVSSQKENAEPALIAGYFFLANSSLMIVLPILILFEMVCFGQLSGEDLKHSS